MQKLTKFVFGTISVVLLDSIAWTQSVADIDHAGIIRDWNADSLARGKAFFESACVSCHGLDGRSPSHPRARAFGAESLRFGNDPYSMYRTLTFGAGAMLPQTWLSPAERYDVVHYIRENFIGPSDTIENFEITGRYLDQLPKGRDKGRRSETNPRDFGPVLCSQIERRVNLALTFELDHGVSMSYDLQRMAVTDVWRGELDLSQTQHIRLRGERQPVPRGDTMPGLATFYWRLEQDDSPPPSMRHDTWIDGSESSSWLPKDQMNYRGHFVYGRSAALAYAVHGREILEMPGAIELDGIPVVHHTFAIDPGDQALDLILGDYNGEGWPIDAVLPIFGGQPADAESIALVGGETPDGDYGDFIAAFVSGDTTGVTWRLNPDQQIVMTIPASERSRAIRLYHVAGNGPGQLEAFVRLAARSHERGALDVPDIGRVSQGGPRLWRDTFDTDIVRNDRTPHYDPRDYDEDRDKRRTVSAAHMPFTVDTINLPEPNPWNAWMRMSDLAFFDDGTLAAATLGGDVWLVTGLDGDRATWRRFASGLFEPLGLRVIGGTVYVTCRGGIVRLHDLNGDGQADYYENFHGDHEISNGFHGYNFDLQRDDEGFLYYIKPGRFTDYRIPGSVVRVAPDGSAYELLATGFRVPNGMGRYPDGTLLATDNQGSWVPANKINVIEPGNFYGVFQRREKESERFDTPMLWLPQEFDNSPGNLVFAADERFGPLSGKMIGSSFGKGWLYYILPERVDDTWQGAAVGFPFQFRSGTMRVARNPADGQIYATGLTGWDTESTQQEGSLQRIRYTGGPGVLVTGVQTNATGVTLAFSSPLDRETATNTRRYQIERWNYRRTHRYGSDHYSVERPAREGHDEVFLSNTSLSPDGRTVALTIPGMKPANTIRIAFDLLSAEGVPVNDLVYMTVHRLPAR